MLKDESVAPKKILDYFLMVSCVIKIAANSNA